MPLSQIKHIVFDLDHTLWDFDKNSQQALSIIFDDLKLASKLNSFEKFYQQYIMINDRMWSEYRIGKLSKANLRSGRFEETLKTFGLNDKVLAEQIGTEYIRISPTQTNLIPGAIEVLEYLSKKYPLHILTNGFEEVQDKKMSNTGLKKYFKTITCSEEIGINKPNLEIFVHKQSKISASPEEILMIGDSLEADIDGALNAGWSAIYYGSETINSTLSVQHLDSLLMHL